MRSKKCFIVVVTLAACLFGLHTTLWGQEPNDIEELKTTIAKLEKQIEQQESKIKRLREELRAGKEELQAEQEENKRLTKICREAGIKVEEKESPTQADYEVCTTPIDPNNIISNSVTTLGFPGLEVGALGYIDYFRIEQIIDDSNAIVIIRMDPYLRDPTYEELLAHRFDVTVWLKGVQTKGHADDTSLTVRHYFAVTGTKTYETAFGQKTLYVIEPAIISPKRLKQEIQRYEERQQRLYGQHGSQKKKGR